MKPLSSPLQQYWQTVVERLPEPLAEKSLSAQAKSVLTFSDFVQDSVIAHPEWLTELESQSPQADEWQHYAAWLQEALSNVSDEAGLMRELRLFRRRIMVRIAWAQTLALVTEESILQQLSHLAETLIVAARDCDFISTALNIVSHVKAADTLFNFFNQFFVGKSGHYAPASGAFGITAQ